MSSRSPREATIETLEARTLLSSVIEWSFNSARSFTFVDSNQQEVTVRLSGPGSGTVSVPDGGGDAERIYLVGTDARSSLTVSVKGGSTNVAAIDVLGSLKGLNASKVNVQGDITIEGTLGKMTLAGLEDGILSLYSGIQSDTVARIPSATLNLGAVTDASIDSNGLLIASLNVASWIDTGADDIISSPSIGKLSSKGRFEADLNLSAPVVVGKNTLGSAKIGGDLQNADWRIAGSTKSITITGTAADSVVHAGGDIGTLKAGGSVNSHFLAGIIQSADTPQYVEEFVGARTIKSASITGLKLPRGTPQGDLFVNSSIAAANIGKVNLRNVDSPIDGVLALYAGTKKEIKQVSIYDTASRVTEKYSSNSGLLYASPKLRIELISAHMPPPDVTSATAQAMQVSGQQFDLVNLDASNGDGMTGACNVYENRIVSLAASAVDLYGTGELTYHWTQDVVAGGGKYAVAITGADTATPSFVAPTIAAGDTAADMTLVLNVAVTNSLGLTGTRSVTIVVRLAGDVNWDNRVDGEAGQADQDAFSDAWFSANLERYDLNGDGIVDTVDSGIVGSNGGRQVL